MGGQQMSRPATTAPFENYQVYTGQAGAMAARAAGGPALPPSGMYVNNDVAGGSQIGLSAPIQPSRQQLYRVQRGGGQMPQDRPMRGYDLPQGGNMMDDMGFFQDDDNMSGMPDRRRPQFEYEPDYYPQRSGGMAREMISGIRQQTQDRINPARAQQYRNMPPPQQQPPQQATAQPKIVRYRTVVDEPRGYVPPTQASQGYSYQQPAAQQVQQPQSSSTPQQILYYDPQTGAIQNPNQVQQAPAPAQQPVYLSYQQPAQAAPTMAYQQPAPAAPTGYQFANAMPQGYMMPQYGMAQQQPIVIPAQVFSK